MDDSIMPCSDFYEYACGKWPELNEAHKDDYTTAEEKANHEVNMELTQYMDNIPMSDQPEFVQKAYSLYTSCTDNEQFNGLNYLWWFKSHKNLEWALWPSDEGVSDGHLNWAKTLGTFRRFGMLNIFVDLRMFVDKEDPSKNVLRLTKPESFAPLTHEDIEHLNKALDIKTTFEEKWNDLSEFEKLLQKLNDEKEDDDNEIELLNSIKDQPVVDVLQRYVAASLDLPALPDSMEISVENYHYMESLDALLRAYDDEFLCGYLEVRFLWYLYENLKYFSDEYCMATTRARMPMATHWIYGQLHPELEAQIPAINEMFINLIGHMKKSLSSDKKAIVPKSFLDKLDTIQLKVGNYPRFDTIEVLESFYANVTLNSSDFYGNCLQLLEFHANIELSNTNNELKIDVNTYFDKADAMGSSIYPYYREADNIVVVPLALLRPPLYHWGWMDIYKYSSLGYNLLHALHMSLAYQNGFGYADSLRIADIGSLNSAYHAHFHDQNVSASEITQFGYMQMDWKQLFFLNFAHTHCQNDISSQDYNAVNFISTQMPEFVKVFDCKLNSFLELFTHI
ncbi:neprilysin-11 [Stomoxys calcitrans]|uniref:neprilysin-11 n=1 Tax=Stomoxys calcitrans TaxID=35570 RepID=UPI0027E30279|nr:neprilysin-11 [Stomoxys calcitrans]